MKFAHGIWVVSLSLACAASDPPVDDTGSASASTSASDTGTTASSTAADSSTGEVATACVDAGWDTSLAAYEALAAQAGDTYWYAIRSFEYVDDFTWACSYRTTVEFVAGVAVRRTFELAEVAEGNTEDQCTGVPFVEQDAEVGSNDAPYATAATPMPALYAGCCDLLALEPADSYTFHFDLDGDGVVAACYAIENDCGEGCEASVDGFDGFSFESFAFGTP